MKILGLLLFPFAGLAAEPLGYAPAPNDTYWPELWHLEHLNTNTVRRGIDINVRSAWSLTRGGPTIAIVDDGVELTHPDLAGRSAPTGHWNFATDQPNGNHPIDRFFHGTGVAGMAVAQGNNQRGIIGVAPDSRFVSWVIYPTNAPIGQPFVTSTQRARMFEFLNQDVPIQNHSWVFPGANFVAIGPEENLAISNAVTIGRGGKGVVMVRAAGNHRIAPYPRNVNDDAYLSDPRVITVAAIRADGRVASYSTPGAAVLVGAPSGDGGFVTPFSTDRAGSSRGYNQITFPDSDHADYVFSGLWLGGTSSAAPLVSGVVALILAANPDLTYRDVQQILIHSARQTDPSDPMTVENGAGFRVSPNTGFGLVDAGTAVDLARRWPSRPALVTRRWTVENTQPIPDGGLRVVVSDSNFLPPEGVVILAVPGLGLVPDAPTDFLPLTFVGQGLEITQDLTGQGALIRRGGAPFLDKIENASRAGAAFAIVYNNTSQPVFEVMGNTDFASIPAVFISQAEGDVIASILTNDTARARLSTVPAQMEFSVTDSLLTEHVRVELTWEHEQRGDVRVTLVSPAGTRSILQRISDVTNSYSNTWTYTSTAHFYESSVGAWKVEVSDQVPGGTGLVHAASLEIRGVSMVDSDADGLDDRWETQWFGSLAFGPKDDPDGDGSSNAREQILGTDPTANDAPLQLHVALWGSGFVRLNWPSREGIQYEILAGADLAQPFTVVASVPGEFPRTAWFGQADPRHRFFRVRERP